MKTTTTNAEVTDKHVDEAAEADILAYEAQIAARAAMTAIVIAPGDYAALATWREAESVWHQAMADWSRVARRLRRLVRDAEA